MDQLAKVLALSQELTPFCLVGLDSNGHSPLWGLDEVNLDKIWELTKDVLGEGDFLVVNHRDSPHTFYGDRGQRSWIDITTMSPALAAHIGD